MRQPYLESPNGLDSLDARGLILHSEVVIFSKRRALLAGADLARVGMGATSKIMVFENLQSMYMSQIATYFNADFWLRNMRLQEGERTSVGRAVSRMVADNVRQHNA